MAVRLLWRHGVVLDDHWRLMRELLMVWIASKLLLCEVLVLCRGRRIADRVVKNGMIFKMMVL